MILGIDTGNTHTVIGALQGSEAVEIIARFPTNRNETGDGYAVRIATLLNLRKIDVSDIEGVVISSVVPSVTESLRQAMRLITGTEPMVLGGDVHAGLEILAGGGVIAPDLEAAAIAAKAYYPLPCVIIDMGTATTVTIVDENGAYIGGAIVPGAMTALKALTSGTALLPSIEIVAPEKAIATETAESMQSGLVYGSAGAVDGIIDHMEKEMKTPPASIVATGGLGALISKYCYHDIIVDDALLLRGLWKVWETNRK